MKIATILDQIDIGSMALPEFQRGYVWNRDQVRGLMQSLYRRFPVGSLLVWVTKTETAIARGDGALSAGSVKLLLDGQQRITSLYGIIRGSAPQFYEGAAGTFTGLYFNVDDEAFEFYAPVKMRDNPYWFSVTEVMQSGAMPFYSRIHALNLDDAALTRYLQRLNEVSQIKDIELHVEEVTGEDKTVDVVVDIFNRVNSGGTKLSKGDLALAKICAAWPDAREELKKCLAKWRQAGFNFRLEWFLRNINTILTGEALFSALKDVETVEFQRGVKRAEQSVDTILNLIAGRLGLDHDRVLGGPSAIPLMSRYLVQRGGHMKDYRERDQLLYWYVHSFLWGRYAGSSESVLNQDLAAIEHLDGALDRLIQLLRQNRGDLRLQPRDFIGWSMGARFYPLLYLLTRVSHARDWETGVELSNNLLGKFSQLQVHHIFPKALLYRHGYPRPEVNALANFTFLTAETNLRISDRDPADYLEEFVHSQPGAVASHWIPMDRELWQVERYPEFLAARRGLLATAANDFLESLVASVRTDVERELPGLSSSPAAVPAEPADNDEEQLILKCNAWVVRHGLPEGEFLYNLADAVTGESLAIIDLAWPNGLQEGYSQPVALLLGTNLETEEQLNRAGYLFFTEEATFRDYVEREILAVHGEMASA